MSDITHHDKLESNYRLLYYQNVLTFEWHIFDSFNSLIARFLKVYLAILFNRTKLDSQ